MRLLRRAKSVLFNRYKILLRRIRLRLGIPVRLKFDDRRVLEQIIIPEVAKISRRVLFVGCEYYTKHYRKLFRRSEYYTLEIDPEKARWGSPGKHVVGGLENVRSHYAENFFDAIICNGVYGWGLDEYKMIEQAIGGCFRVLRPGGVFVFGWNDVPEHTPIPLDQIEGFLKFQDFVWPSLNSERHVCEGSLRHTFDFYTKPIK